MRLTITTRLLVFLTLSGCARMVTSPPALIIRRSAREYDLHGKTLTELVYERRAMAARGEAPESMGRTIWAFTLNTSRAGGAQTSCASDGIIITLTLNSVLPRAVNSKEFTANEFTQWQAFLPGLARHEARHDSVVVAESSAFLRRVTAEKRANTATRSVAKCVDELTAQLSRAGDKLDEVTQNGRTDGAVLILNGNPPRAGQSPQSPD